MIGKSMKREILVRWGWACIGYIPEGIRKYPIANVLEITIPASGTGVGETRYAALRQVRLGCHWGATLGVTFTPQVSSSSVIQVAACADENAYWALTLENATCALNAAAELISADNKLGPGLLRIDRTYCTPEEASPHAVKYVTRGMIHLLDPKVISASDEDIVQLLDAPLANIGPVNL
jgi:hypothetical protein